MKGVGKPCKGKPYARIDGGRLETEAPSTVTTGGTTQRETAGMQALGPTDDHATAPASYPPTEVWALTRHYLTLLILHSIGYCGSYRDLRKIRGSVWDVGEVPWK